MTGDGKFDEARQVLDEALPYAQGIVDHYQNTPDDKRILSGIHASLGKLHYRTGDWNATIESLQKATEWRFGSIGGGSGVYEENADGFDWFFLAMAHWQLGEKDEAREWYERAVEWTENNKNREDDEALQRLRSEAAELLGIDESPPEKNEKRPTDN